MTKSIQLLPNKTNYILVVLCTKLPGGDLGTYTNTMGQKLLLSSVSEAQTNILTNSIKLVLKPEREFSLIDKQSHTVITFRFTSK